MIKTIVFILLIPCTSFAMDWVDFIAGGASCIIIHELSHMAVMDHQGTDYYMRSNGMFHLTDPHGSEYLRDMAGFAGQHLVGAALTQWKPQSDFTKGYNITSALITISYPMRLGWNSDLDGGRKTEYAVFIGIDLMNLIRTDWN